MTALAPMTTAGEAVPVVPWDAFAGALTWRQGEHVALVGPTGQGKTTLALSLLQLRDWRVILGTKPRDDTLGGLVKREGYVKVGAWPPPVRSARLILWPKWQTPDDTARQRAVLHHALGRMFAEGSWTILADDVQYLTTMLGLSTTLDLLWLQGRALKLTLVAATQRPRWVPRNMWTQTTHLFVWGSRDADDLKALGGLNGADTATVRGIVAELPRHHALYVNTRTGAMAVTVAPRRPEGR